MRIEEAHRIIIFRSSRHDFSAFRIEILCMLGISFAGLCWLQASAALADYKGVSIDLRGDEVSDQFAAVGEQLLQHGTPGLLLLAGIELQPRRCGGLVDAGYDVVVLF